MIKATIKTIYVYRQALVGNIKKFNNIISTAINTYNYLVNSRSTTKKSLINHKNKTIRIDP